MSVTVSLDFSFASPYFFFFSFRTVFMQIYFVLLLNAKKFKFYVCFSFSARWIGFGFWCTEKKPKRYMFCVFMLLLFHLDLILFYTYRYIYFVFYFFWLPQISTKIQQSGTRTQWKIVRRIYTKWNVYRNMCEFVSLVLWTRARACTWIRATRIEWWMGINETRHNQTHRELWKRSAPEHSRNVQAKKN